MWYRYENGVLISLFPHVGPDIPEFLDLGTATEQSTAGGITVSTGGDPGPGDGIVTATVGANV